MKHIVSPKIVFWFVTFYGFLVPFWLFIKAAFWFVAATAANVPTDFYVGFPEAMIRGTLAGVAVLFTMRWLLKSSFDSKKKDKDIGLKVFIASITIYAISVLSSAQAWSGATNIIEFFIYSVILGWSVQFYTELFSYEESKGEQSALKEGFFLKKAEMEFKRSSDLFHELVWVGLGVFTALGVTPSLYFWYYTKFNLSLAIFWQYWTVSVFSTLYLVIGFIFGVLLPIYAKNQAIEIMVQELGEKENAKNSEPLPKTSQNG